MNTKHTNYTVLVSDKHGTKIGESREYFKNSVRLENYIKSVQASVKCIAVNIPFCNTLHINLD